MSFFQKFRIYSLSNNTIIIRSLVAHLLRRQSCKQKARVRSWVGVFCTFSQKHYYFLFFLFKMTIQFFLLSQFYSTFQREKDFRINLKATIFYGVRKSRPFLPCCVAAEKSARLLNPVKNRGFEILVKKRKIDIKKCMATAGFEPTISLGQFFFELTFYFFSSRSKASCGRPQN